MEPSNHDCPGCPVCSPQKPLPRRVLRKEHYERDQHYVGLTVGEMLTLDGIMGMSARHALCEDCEPMDDYHALEIEVQSRATRYTGSDPVAAMSRDGIDFYGVGHNASHSFYLGVAPGGRHLLRLSIGETGEVNEFGDHEIVEHMTAVSPDDVGYIGHF